MILRLAICVCGLVFVALAVTARAQSSNSPNEVDLDWGVKIPARDGVKLNATVYKPHAMPEGLPIIFTLTPYVSDTYHEQAMYFARQGYVFALIDVRGRGNSQGTYEPYSHINTARDGYDIVEWLAKQRWSNGKVAMWGGSYGGYDQWTTAAQFPPHLVTIVPYATAHPTLDLFNKNIFTPALAMGFLSHTSGAAQNLNLRSDGSFWYPKLMELHTGRAAVRDFDRLSGNPSWIYQKWMDHLKPDAYWDTMLPSPEQYRRLNIPIMHVTGYFDSLGAIWFHKQHMKFGSVEGKSKHFLIVGPWTHAGTRVNELECCGQKFGPASKLDMLGLHKAWYDWTMKGGPKPEFLKDRVAYYEPGPEEWKYSETLEAIPSIKQTLYLHAPKEKPETGRSPGKLIDKLEHSLPETYDTDPLDIRRTEGGLSNFLMITSLGNGLVYHSEPFKDAVQLTGFMKLVVWLSMDVPDTDFYVTVNEVQADGRVIGLGTDRMRARYRESLRKEVLVTPGTINKYEFNGFHMFSKRIGKGSLLRLMISSMPFPGDKRNFNSGKAVQDETAKDARTARITLYHDPQHPSFLEIPVVK